MKWGRARATRFRCLAETPSHDIIVSERIMSSLSSQDRRVDSLEVEGPHSIDSGRLANCRAASLANLFVQYWNQGHRANPSP